MADDSQDPNRPDRIASVARSLADYCEERQRVHARIAQDFGYSSKALEIIASNYSGKPDDPLFAETEASLKKFGEFVRARENQTQRLAVDVASASYTIATTTSSAVQSVAFNDLLTIPGNHRVPDPPPHWTGNRTQIYAKRLSKLDPELGRLLRSIGQSLYGGAENAERAALLSMRQLYDHLFGLLAPDDEVRKSPVFQPKEGDKPDQIHRIERLHYVATIRVKDITLARLLQEESTQVLKIYDRLNMLHARQRLSSDTAREALRAMQAVIEQWIDALEL